MKIVIITAIFFPASFSVFSQPVVWTKNKGINIATSSRTIPAFPRAISGYKSAGLNKDYWGESFEWEGNVRVFDGEGWTKLSDFPYTMNSCSKGIFMIRRRTSNPNVRVSSTVAYSEETISTAKTGSFGYMFGSNCEQPLFKFGNSKDDGTLADIYYELKFWKAAP